MADPNNNRNQQQSPQQDEGSSTISYLPILFANGYPTSLEKMTVEQLELFIPFLIKCSLSLKLEEEPTSAPKWWPANVKFRIPFEKPKDFKKDWGDLMRSLVIKCYEHHKQPFLLKYSKDLSVNDTANLRYVKSSDTTTALWSRVPEKLLLTFRNELMLYDRKKRRQLWKKDESIHENQEAESTIDIFLCDFCDATFVSEEAYTEHELKCNRVKEPNAEQETVENIVISDDDVEEEDEENEIANTTNQTNFMAYFYLVNAQADELPRRYNSSLERSLSPKKKKKPAARTRKTISQKDREREFTIPFSSPLGMVLFKKTADEDYAMDKLEDIESFSQAKPTTKIHRTKMRFQQSNTETQLMRQMRKVRPYYWPKRQLNSSCREKNFEFLNRWLVEDCKPFNIVARKFTPEDIKSYKERLIQIKEEKLRADCVDLISDSDSDSNVELDDEASMKFKGLVVAMPMPSDMRPSTSKTLPQIFDTSKSFHHLTNDEFDMINQHLTSTTTTIITHNPVKLEINDVNVNGYLKRQNDEELTQKSSKRSKVIHNWLNNVSGENLQITNQLSLINS